MRHEKFVRESVCIIVPHPDDEEIARIRWFYKQDG